MSQKLEINEENDPNVDLEGDTDEEIERGEDPLIPDMHRLIMRLYIKGYYDRSLLSDEIYISDDEEEESPGMDPLCKSWNDKVEARVAAKKEWMRWAKAREVCRTWRKLADEMIGQVGVKVAVQPLTAAARGGFLESFKLLYSSGAFDPTRDNHETFFSAIQSKNVSILKILLQDGKVDPSSRNSWALVQATLSGCSEIVQMLIEDGRVDLESADNNAIVYSSMEGKADIVQLLLKSDKVDPSARRNEALIMAAQNGHNDVIELLLQHAKVDPTDRNNLALTMAVRGGHLAAVETLLKDGRVDPSVDNNTLLKWAKSISVGNFRQIENLLLKDARVVEQRDQELRERKDSKKRKIENPTEGNEESKKKDEAIPLPIGTSQPQTPNEIQSVVE